MRPLKPLLLLLLFVLLPISAVVVAQPRMAAPAAPAATSTWQRAWRGEGALFALAGRDAQTVLGAGSQGMLLKSTNGGETWRYQSPVTDKDLYDLSAVGANAWAVGQSGTVVFSGDGGNNWKQLPSGLAANLNGVHFLDGANGWVVGDGGLIAHSSNGGASWTPQTSGVAAHLRAVRMFADGQHGVAAGDAGTLLTTTNGGTNWTVRSGVVPAGAVLRDIHVEGNSAWLVGDGGVLRASSDQGASWSPKSIPSFNIYEIEFAPGQTQIGWAAGVAVVSGNITEERLYRTTNGGDNWTAVTSVTGSDIDLQRDRHTASASTGVAGIAVSALGVGDGTHAWVGGDMAVMNEGNYFDAPADKITRDAWFVWGTFNGTAWEHLIGGFYPWYYQIDVVSDQIAYISGQDMTVLKTTDGGETWRELANELRTGAGLADPVANQRATILHGVSCVPGSVIDCRVAGRRGMIAHTTNGGESWTREYPPNYSQSLYDLNVTSATQSVAVGRGAHFYATNSTWAQGTGGATGLDLDMVSPYEGGRSSKRTDFFAYTTNGGQAWRSYIMPTQFAFWQTDGFDAFDANGDGDLDYGWLVGCKKTSGPIDEKPCEGAAILRSANVIDPAAWQSTVLDAASPILERVVMVDLNTGWAVGDQGWIIFTTNGGQNWTRQVVPMSGWLNAVDAHDENLAFAAGEEGVVFRYAANASQTVAAPPQQNTVADGNLDDWTSSGAVSIDASNAASITGATPSPSDLSLALRARWWEARLFLALDVTDDSVQPDDRIDIALDGLDDNVGGGGDDRTLSIYADGRVTASGFSPTVGVQPRSGGYRVEVQIPAGALGGGFESGRTVGLNLGLSDHEGGGQQSALVWTDASLNANAATFATVAFQPFGGGSATLIAVPAGAMTMDGSLAEWNNDQTLSLTAATADTQQGAGITPADLSADVRARWWPNYVFVGIHVHDATLRPGDAVHLAFDGNDDGEQGGPTDWNIRIGADGSVSNGFQALAYVASAADGYTVEVAVPQSMIGGALAHDRALGFNIGLEDDDAGDAGAESWLVWEGASPGGVYADLGQMRLQAYSLVLQPGSNGYNGVTDTFLDAWLPTANYAASQTLEWRAEGANPAKSGLFKFDLSPLPANSVVSSASLSYYATLDGGQDLTARIYRMGRAWDVNAATWQQAAAGTPWQTAGARGANDRAATATDFKVMTGLGWVTFNVLADVNAFLAGTPNHGWLVEMSDSNARFLVAAAEYTTDLTQRPKLEIRYVLAPSGSLPPPPPPQPPPPAPPPPRAPPPP
ncbi:MAG: DNRLRE domain-containing protein, partial [Caldilineales bacterium]|nr:DNRLRE domain-containing protein [Caldilineales bacterium]